MEDIVYEWIPATLLHTTEKYEKLVEECAELYSSHYGIWSSKSGFDHGSRIRLSKDRILEWLDDNASLYYAKEGEKLIGYAIAFVKKVPKYGGFSWVTQLVVHSDYRNQSVAKKLLHAIWGFTDNYAWGIVTSNPYAVRALEKATRRRGDTQRIKHNLKKILSIGEEYISYINKDMDVVVDKSGASINTSFFVDHSDVEDKITNVTNNVPWVYGNLQEGWEWLVFTFADQLPFELTNDEIEEIINTSDDIAKKAYTRMDLSGGNHLWAKHTIQEVDYIIKECNLSSGQVIMDFGCGNGRHSIELAARGLRVTAIDYVDKFVDAANNSVGLEIKENVEFIIGDCRNITFNYKADTIVCLYDVIGSYGKDEDNQSIINNISRHLKVGGTAIISVMNYHLTLEKAKNKFQLYKSPMQLLSLPPSNTMEESGNIFNPEYYLVDDSTGIVYRKEQFKKGRALPVEYIVRDKRYTREEIIAMCEKAGLVVEETRFVSAKDWNKKLNATDDSAKEILVKCRKSM